MLPANAFALQFAKVEKSHGFDMIFWRSSNQTGYILFDIDLVKFEHLLCGENKKVQNGKISS